MVLGAWGCGRSDRLWSGGPCWASPSMLPGGSQAPCREERCHLGQGQVHGGPAPGEYTPCVQHRVWEPWSDTLNPSLSPWGLRMKESALAWTRVPAGCRLTPVSGLTHTMPCSLLSTSSSLPWTVALPTTGPLHTRCFAFPGSEDASPFPGLLLKQYFFTLLTWPPPDVLPKLVVSPLSTWGEGKDSAQTCRAPLGPSLP